MQFNCIYREERGFDARMVLQRLRKARVLRQRCCDDSNFKKRVSAQLTGPRYTMQR
jgi:hypothetical protein